MSDGFCAPCVYDAPAGGGAAAAVLPATVSGERLIVGHAAVANVPGGSRVLSQWSSPPLAVIALMYNGNVSLYYGLSSRRGPWAGPLLAPGVGPSPLHVWPDLGLARVGGAAHFVVPGLARWKEHDCTHAIYIFWIAWCIQLRVPEARSEACVEAAERVMAEGSGSLEQEVVYVADVTMCAEPACALASAAGPLLGLGEMLEVAGGLCLY